MALLNSPSCDQGIPCEIRYPWRSHNSSTLDVLHLPSGLSTCSSLIKNDTAPTESDNSKDVLPLLERFRPDVLILDLSLPGGPSLPLIGSVSALEFKPQVLILTMHDDPAYVRAALGVGAKGYLVKSVGEQDLLQAIRSVQRGRVVIDLDNEALTASVFSSLVGTHPREGGGTSAKLSDREAEVLRLLGQGLSNQKIAEQLDLSPKTVSTYRARIGDKVGLRTTADFVKYATDLGSNRSQPESLE